MVKRAADSDVDTTSTKKIKRTALSTTPAATTRNQAKANAPPAAAAGARRSARAAKKPTPPPPPPKRKAATAKISAAKASTAKAAAIKKKTAAPTRRATKKSTSVSKEDESVSPKPEPKPKRVRGPPKPKAPTLNALPVPPKPQPSHVFYFGSGDSGQFGLGPDELAEAPRPRNHSWSEKNIEEGVFGFKGVGPELVAAGGMHALVLGGDGEVWSWGVNDNGALGRKTSGDEEYEPMTVPNLRPNFRPVVLAAGDSMSAAVGLDGRLRAWGNFRSSTGSLGFQASTEADKVQYDAIPVPGVEKEKFSSIAAGYNHVVALTLDGKVFTWGVGELGQLGRKVTERHLLNSTRPGLMHLRKIVVVGAGADHSFAVNSDGEVYGWGLNQYGQLGSPPDESGDSAAVFIPTLIPELSPSELGNDARVIKIDGGEHHTAFLTSDGRVYTCGRNDMGQCGLGEGSEQAIHVPTLVKFPPVPTKDTPNPDVDEKGEETIIVDISVGARQNLAVSKQGYLYSWGCGPSAELGLGDVEEQNTPSRIRWKGADDWFVLSAVAGGQHGFFLARKRSDPEFLEPPPEEKEAATNGHAETNGEANGEADGDKDSNDEDEVTGAVLNGDEETADA